MKKYLPTLLLIIINWSFVYSPQVLASYIADQCLTGVSTYDAKTKISNDAKSMQVHIKSDKVKTNYPEHVLFSGNVYIEHGNNTLTADEVHLMQYHNNRKRLPLRIINAKGHVNYYSSEIKLHGSKGWYNLNNKDTNVYDGNYQMIGRQGRGNADTIKQRENNRYTILKNGSFTSCLPDDNSWSILGSEVIYDREEQIARIWNARFKINNLPVLYIPYLQIPVGDKRRYEFFIPKAKYSSNNGFEFNTPYYLYLGHNYDAIITPNYISKRGINIQTEFHYLTRPGKGIVEFDFLPKNHDCNDEYASNRYRWLLYWNHNGVMNQLWRFKVDYTKVNNNLNYFKEIYSKYGSTNNDYATQKLCLGYSDNNWKTILSYKKFQLFDTNSSAAYSTAPQIDINYYKNYFGSFYFKLFSQAVKFTNVNNSYPEAIRLHIEPALSHQLLFNHWGKINAETKLIATHYKQDNIDEYNKNHGTSSTIKKSVNRLLPQFKTDASIVFERNIINSAQEYIQTIEPHLNYLYIPYINQNNIGVYDSTILQSDYYGLFRDRVYSGLDRISSANQLVFGITTRMYDDQQFEWFNASVGQIYYFSQPRTSESDIINTLDNTGSILLAGDGYWRLSNHFGILGGFQYNSRLNIVTLGNAALEYNSEENYLFQLSYRYVNQKYIIQMLSDISQSSYQESISQIGLINKLPLLNHWSLVDVYYYDTKANHPEDQLFGLEYNTCCFAINLGYERKIIGLNYSHNSSQYDNKVYFHIELHDFIGNLGLELEKILSNSMIPYHRYF